MIKLKCPECDSDKAVNDLNQDDYNWLLKAVNEDILEQGECDNE